MLFDINQSGKFGAHFFIQFSDLFDQCLGLLTVFLLNGLVELFSQVDDLAIFVRPILTWPRSAVDVAHRGALSKLPKSQRSAGRSNGTFA